MTSPMMMPNGVVVLTVPNHTPLNQPGQKTERQRRFEKGEPKALGVVQILIGLLQICFGAFLLNNPLGSVYPLSGLPFWGASIFIISGALSVAAEKKGSLGLVRGSMALNIISSVIALTAFILVSIDIFVIYVNLSESSACDGSIPGNDGESCYSYRDGLLAQRSGVLGLALILIALELCITLSTSIFACKAMCRCCGAPQQTQPVVIVQNTYGQQLAYPSVPSPEASTVSPPPYFENNAVSTKS